MRKIIMELEHKNPVKKEDILRNLHAGRRAINILIADVMEAPRAEIYPREIQKHFDLLLKTLL